ncbi:peptidylprolyl isomerase [Roseibacillus persicicus]|uniref:peptidylprolyl isomerase n=1 Tax=Roseibacillus persicicus TaxID=454148 RepID=UPI00398A5A43
MKLDSGAPVRAILYGVALIYLFIDLFVFKGPLYKAIKNSDPRSEQAIREETARGVAARVYYQPILLTQIDWEVERRLWLRGKSAAGLSATELRSQRMAALNGLFERHLLRIKVKFNAAEISVSDEEVAEAVKRFKRRFASEPLLDGAIANQGWDGEAELVARVRAKLEQEAYLEKYIALETSEAELKSFFEENQERFRLPELVELRHIFFTALDHPNGEAFALAQSAKLSLEQGKDFAALAAELSEDPASKEAGGYLGWVSRERLPDDFGEAVFALSGATGNLVETSLGAHVVEVIARKPSRLREYEEVRDELAEAFSNQRREEGTTEYLRILLHRESANVEIFTEVLERPWSLGQE